MAETNRMTSDTAVNAKEREIAQVMDDVKQEEDSSMERPKEQRIEQMIGDAERKQAQKTDSDKNRTLPA